MNIFNRPFFSPSLWRDATQQVRAVQLPTSSQMDAVQQALHETLGIAGPTQTEFDEVRQRIASAYENGFR